MPATSTVIFEVIGFQYNSFNQTSEFSLDIVRCGLSVITISWATVFITFFLLIKSILSTSRSSIFSFTKSQSFGVFIEKTGFEASA